MMTAMTRMSGKELPTTYAPAFETPYGATRERFERDVAHGRRLRQERLSLAERIEQALLEAERLHGD
jgi:hypothetical protein